MGFLFIEDKYFLKNSQDLWRSEFCGEWIRTTDVTVPNEAVNCLLGKALCAKRLARMDTTHPPRDRAISPVMDRAVMAFTVLLALTLISTFRYSSALNIRDFQRSEFPDSAAADLSTFWYVTIAAPVLWGWFADRCSVKVVCLVAFAAESLLFFRLALVGSGWMTELNYLALSSINMCWIPVGASLIATHLSQHRRSFLFALIFCADTLGINFSQDVIEQFGWRAVAVAFGLGPMVLAVACLMFPVRKTRPQKGSIRLRPALLVPLIGYVLATASARVGTGFWSIERDQGMPSMFTVETVTRLACIVALFICWFIGQHKDLRRSQSNRRIWSVLLAAVATAAVAWVGWANQWIIVCLLVFFSSTIAFRAVQCASLSSLVGAEYSGRLIGFQVTLGWVGLSIVGALVHRHPWATWPLATLLIALAGLLLAIAKQAGLAKNPMTD